MLQTTLFGRTFRHYFDMSGRATRTEYFTFLTYCAATTGGMIALEDALPTMLTGKVLSLAGLFLAVHTLPLVGVFLRRLRDAGQSVPVRLVPVWVVLALGFLPAQQFGIGALYGLVVLTLGQLLCFNSLALKSEEIEELSNEEDEDFTTTVWHQRAETASRGTSEIYRVKY
ncbi:MAG: DUF805 domain-containing protein [Deltaproteobacteria bacterium]